MFLYIYGKHDKIQQIISLIIRKG